MRRILIGLVAAVAGTAGAQPVVGPPVPAEAIVDGWTIASTKLGCAASPVSAEDSTQFTLKQDGTESWSYAEDPAINRIDVDNAIVKLGKVPSQWSAPVKWVTIDGRRFEMAALANKGILGRLANARSIVVHVEGYVNRASQKQLLERITADANARKAAQAAGRPAPPSRFPMEDYRRETVDQKIRTPGPLATRALRACALAPRAPNRVPEFTQRRDPGPASPLGGGGSFDQLLGRMGASCRNGPLFTQMPAMDWLVSLDADGEVKGVDLAPGAAPVARSDELRDKLRRTLIASAPATDAQGKFMATRIAYRSKPNSVGCRR